MCLPSKKKEESPMWARTSTQPLDAARAPGQGSHGVHQGTSLEMDPLQRPEAVSPRPPTEVPPDPTPQSLAMSHRSNRTPSIHTPSAHSASAASRRSGSQHSFHQSPSSAVPSASIVYSGVASATSPLSAGPTPASAGPTPLSAGLAAVGTSHMLHLGISRPSPTAFEPEPMVRVGTQVPSTRSTSTASPSVLSSPARSPSHLPSRLTPSVGSRRTGSPHEIVEEKRPAMRDSITSRLSQLSSIANLTDRDRPCHAEMKCLTGSGRWLGHFLYNGLTLGLTFCGSAFDAFVADEKETRRLSTACCTHNVCTQRRASCEVGEQRIEWKVLPGWDVPGIPTQEVPVQPVQHVSEEPEFVLPDENNAWVHVSERSQHNDPLPSFGTTETTAGNLNTTQNQAVPAHSSTVQQLDTSGTVLPFQYAGSSAPFAPTSFPYSGSSLPRGQGENMQLQPSLSCEREAAGLSSR